MKVGIVTFHSAHNYGAVLQAWSLQEYLKQQGCEVEMVNLRLPVIDKLYYLTYKTHKKVTGIEGVDNLANKLYFNARALSIRLKDPKKYEKYSKFEHFINHKLPVTKEFKKYKDLVAAKLNYDVLIVGSDQVWNATMMKGINPAYFLQFSGENTIRISYAASIGTDEIPEKFQLLFKRYLREFDAISVREKNAKAQVEKLTDKEIDLVADPTFLLKREDFNKIKKKSNINQKYIYVHNVHLKRVDDALNSVAEELSKKTGLPIVHNWNQKVYKKEAGHFTGGIEEFLGMVEGAEYVVTNSFHCTVFAIIYRRNFITVPHFKHPDRMINLLGELGLSEHLIDNGANIPENLNDLGIDYQKVEEKKEAMGEHAREFLGKALKTEKVKDDRNYFEVEDVFRCYGCSACKDVCPTDAITMVEDKEGFIYPKINEDKCIHCDKCKRTCIYHQEASKNEKSAEYPLVYAAYHKDRGVLKESASGGMFTPLYKAVLEKKGKVVGVKLDDSMTAVYDIASTEEECQKFRGSKYVYADSLDVKRQVKAILDNGEYVLFSGTPCQIAGLNSFLGKKYDKLYTVELICHGVSSPKVYRLYREHLEEVYQSKIVDFKFRNEFKNNGEQFTMVEFESGSIDVELSTMNNFSKAFRNNNIERPCCYTCEYAGLKKGVGDITIGDYWGIEAEHPEFQNDMGVSLIKINTPKGKKLFDDIKADLQLLESTYEKAYRANHTKPMVMTSNRTKLMHYIDEKPIDPLLLTFNKKKKGGIKGL